ncbi:Uncharacterised protein [Odoribacter splanchnicus]|nr:Uncharacterised protein [Odoribacter splanchnicus]
MASVNLKNVRFKIAEDKGQTYPDSAILELLVIKNENVKIWRLS